MTPLRLFETFCSLTLQVALVVLVTAWLGRMLCRDERDRDRLWSGCLLALLLLLVYDLCLPHLRLLPVPASLVEPAVGMQLEARVGVIWWLAGLWIAGALVMLGRLVGESLRAIWLLHQSVAIAPEKLPAPWGRMPAPDKCEGPDTRAAVSPRSAVDPLRIRFLSTATSLGPFCWQFQRPTIVLPQVVLSFPADQIAAVIRHESVHLVRAHPLWLFVQRLTEAALWFHPAVWWAGRQASAAREFACDRQAAPTPETAAALLRSLLRLAELGCRPTPSSLASAATGASASVLAERARRLSGRGSAPSRCHSRFNWTLVPTLIALAAMTLLLWVPIDLGASTRSLWSPWPTWSARTLQSVGIAARDYEIDGHRLHPYGHST